MKQAPYTGDGSQVADKVINAARHLVDLSIGAGQIAAGAITTAKIAAGAITTALLADLAVTDAKINDMAGSKLTGAVTATRINNQAADSTFGIASGTKTITVANLGTTAETVTFGGTFVSAAIRVYISLQASSPNTDLFQIWADTYTATTFVMNGQNFGTGGNLILTINWLVIGHAV